MTDIQLRQAITDIADDGNNTALEVRNILNEIMFRLPKKFDIKIKLCPNTYIQTNFTISGLGILEEEGWAICNGNNGTDNWGGRVPIAYDGFRYNIISEKLGSPHSIVPAHYHNVYASQRNGENSSVTTEAFFCNSGSSNDSQTVGVATTTSGESGDFKNIQPSVVTLVLMRIV